MQAPEKKIWTLVKKSWSLLAATLGVLGSWAPDNARTGFFAFLGSPIMWLVYLIMIYGGIGYWLIRLETKSKVGEGIQICALAIAIFAFGVHLGWNRMHGVFNDANGGNRRKTVTEMLPDEVMRLRHQSPNGMGSDEYELWKQLTPCNKLRDASWMAESDAFFEIRESILFSTNEDISDKNIREFIKRRIRNGQMNVRFTRRGEGWDRARRVPLDSVEIVFEVTPYESSYMRQYWSDDICHINSQE